MANGIINYASMKAKCDRLNALTDGNVVSSSSENLLLLIETLMIMANDDCDVPEFYKKDYIVPFKDDDSDEVTELKQNARALYEALDIHYAMLSYIANELRVVPILLERLNDSLNEDFEEFKDKINIYNPDCDEEEDE